MSSGIDLRKIRAASIPAKKGKPLAQVLQEFFNKDISFGKKGWGNSQRENFYSELNTLLTSGLDIRSSIELIEEEQEKPASKELVKQIKDRIVRGESFYEALRSTGQFSPYEYYSIKIGEETGNLPIILKDLVKYYAGRIKQQRQIVSLLSYPVLVSTTAILAVVFMLNFIVPMFADVFKRFGGELPGITKFIMGLSKGFSHYFFLIVLFIISIIAVAFTQSKKEWYRHYMSKFLLRLPLIGDILRKVYLARFCQVMSLLAAAKVPMLDAIDLVGKMISFYPLEVSLKQVEKDIFNGISLHQSLSQFPIYHKRMISLVKVAEEANQLDTIFEKLASQLSAEVEHQTGLLSSLLEPIIIIFLASIVGVILIAMYLPMFQLSTNIK